MNQKIQAVIIVLFSFLLSGALQSKPIQAAEKKAKERLAVIDLVAKYGVDKALAEALSVIVRDKLHSFGEYQVMSTEDNLGSMYSKGKGGLSQDKTKAVEWYRKAADHGNPFGMSNLGWMYETGEGGLAKDAAKAVEWYKKSAVEGGDRGMYNLGLMYEKGKGGLIQDQAKAIEWFKKAAKAGNQSALKRLKELGLE